MAALAAPLISSGISALAGLFGAKPKPITTNFSSSGNSSSESSTHADLTAQQQDLINQLIGGYQQRLAQGTDLSGYAGQGLRNINNAGNIARKMSNNSIAARGLSQSPYAGFQNIAQDQAQAGNSANFLNGLPLLQRQMQGEDLSGLSRIFSMIPTNTSTQGNQQFSQSGQQVQSGGGSSGIGGLLGGLGVGLAGPNGGTGQSNLQGILGNIFGNKPPSGPNTDWSAVQRMAGLG